MSRLVRSTRQPQSPGFTLVELLVVVSIIALLLALLTPTLSRAREMTKSVACRSNLHQMGNGLQTYLATYKYYPGGHTAGGVGTYVVWAPRIRMYCGYNSELFNCPVAPTVQRWKTVIDPALNLPKRWGYLANERPLYWNTPFSYGYNNWGQGQDFSQPQWGLGGYAEWRIQGNAEDWDALEASRVKVPADMIAVGDSKSEGVWDAFIDPQPGETREWPNDPHLQKSNIVFCDSHVETLAIAELVDPFTDNHGKSRWNNDNQRH